MEFVFANDCRHLIYGLFLLSSLGFLSLFTFVLIS